MSKSPVFDVPALTRPEHEALKSLCNGDADKDQQMIAVAVIVKKIAQPQDLLYIPDSPDQTAFLNGRAFVAAQIRYYKNAKVSETKEESNDVDK